MARRKQGRQEKEEARVEEVRVRRGLPSTGSFEAVAREWSSGESAQRFWFSSTWS